MPRQLILQVWDVAAGLIFVFNAPQVIIMYSQGRKSLHSEKTTTAKKYFRVWENIPENYLVEAIRDYQYGQKGQH